MIPKYVFFTKGIGKHKIKLQSFEFALRDAGISQLNLVEVSSILPPNCIEISKEEGLKMLKPGQIIFVVLSRHCSCEISATVGASIGVAKLKEVGHYGYLSEHHYTGNEREPVGDFAEDLAASMLASSMGISFDVDTAYDEEKDIFYLKDKVIETKNITSLGKVTENGIYTTVIAAAVFVLEK